MDLMDLFYFGGGALILLGVLWQFFTSSRTKARRSLRELPHTQISVAPEGEVVKIVGRVRFVEDSAPLEAPLSGRACACYEVKVEQRLSLSERYNSRAWQPVLEERRARPFTVVDETGVALIEAHRPELLLKQGAHLKTGLLIDPTDRMKALLARHGQKSQLLFINKQMRYVEGVLEEGEVVAVIGRCRWEQAPTRGSVAGANYRELPKRPVLNAPRDGKLVITDKTAYVFDPRR